MTDRWASTIQPVALRSPEVLIGAEWDTKTDIWNFGCIVRFTSVMSQQMLTSLLIAQILEFARGATLFDPQWKNKETGMSPTQTHLAQMVRIVGEFSSEFLKTGKKASRYFDDEGRLLCSCP